MLTVHEFLTRLVADESARSVFDTDPRGSLEQAGLGAMSDVDVLQSASLVLQFARADEVDSLVRAIRPGMEKLTGGGRHAPIANAMPLMLGGSRDDVSSDNDSMEWDMNPEIFSAVGDVDQLLGSGAGEGTTNVDSSETNDSNESMNTVGSGNQVGPNSLVGDVDVQGVAGDVTGAANSGDVNAGNVVGNGVTDVVGGVDSAVDGNAMGSLDGVTGQVDDTTADLGGVTSMAGDIEPSQDVAGQAGLTAPITGAEGPVGTVTDTVGGASGMADDVTGGLGL